MNFDSDDNDIPGETRSRSQDGHPVRFSSRRRRPPAYLSDYVVGMNHELDEIMTTRSEISVGSARSTSSSVLSRLSDKQTAELETVKRKHELDELKKQLEEDRDIAVHIKHMEDEASETRHELERLERSIKKERESRMSQIAKERNLREAENRYKEAMLISSMIDSGDRIKEPVVSETSYPRELNTEVTYPAQFSDQGEPTTDRHIKREIEHSYVDHNHTLRPSADVFAPRQNKDSHVNQSPAIVPQPILASDVPSVELPMNAMLISSVYGIPKPTLPEFKSGKERDFILLKMALETLVDVHPHLTETYKYQLLLDKLGNKPRQLAEAFMFHPTPYTKAVQELQRTYGSAGQLIQSEISALLNSPPIRFGDYDAFENFALRIQSLVGMLKSMQSGAELHCASHVSTLITKLPHGMRDNFTEHCIKQGLYDSGSNATYNLTHLDQWLQLKSRAKRLSHQAVPRSDSMKSDKRMFRRTVVSSQQSKETSSASTFYTQQNASNGRQQGQQVKVKPKFKGYCPKCISADHFLNTCPEFKKLSDLEVESWLRDRCFRCARKHKPEDCNLKTPCQLCTELHLTALHDACRHMTAQKVMFSKTSSSYAQVYLDQPSKPFSTMLKVVEVTLYGQGRSMNAYAILDDGSQRTMILESAVKSLNLLEKPDTILLTTIRREPYLCSGQSVNLQVSAKDMPEIRYNVLNAFTSSNLSLSEYTYPVAELQKQWAHIRDLPLPHIDNAKPVILIGSDLAELIVPQEPVRSGPSGSPIAVHTRLGWSLQGTHSVQQQVRTQTVLFTEMEYTSLMSDVQALWKMDVMPYLKKDVIRSKQDNLAMHILETDTQRVEVNGVYRYATPLLRFDDTVFEASKEDMIPTLQRMERRLLNHPARAEIHSDLVHKLVDDGLVQVISDEEDRKTSESWYIPHHVVEQNGKHRLVFNCSYEHDGKNLNKKLLPGPQLGPSLLGVLLRFRQHSVAIAGDIKAMFHQVRLLPRDRSLLRFLWRDMRCHGEPDIYEWQVLPFGTTCSPVCATYALQRHVKNHRSGKEHVKRSVMEAFYVDNCLDSVPTSEDARTLLYDIGNLLDDGGFHVRQWTSNDASVVQDVPSEDRSDSCEMWLNRGGDDQSERTLGLLWYINTDELGYKQKLTEYASLTLRVIYHILAGQYDPIGFLAPFLAVAKCIVQDLWAVKRDWDATIEQGVLYDRWMTWELQLPNVSEVRLPRCYATLRTDPKGTMREIHIFCDASERTYGAVAYMRTVDDGDIHVSFLQARMRVAPKRQLSMPRLELCAALAGAQLLDVLSSELTLPIHRIMLWSDSTTVLTWIKSDSCRYKVFVGTRVAEIQTLTESFQWYYINTASNPADDLKGKNLIDISDDQSRWRNGPTFLHLSPDQWPIEIQPDTVDDSEVKTRCMLSAMNVDLPVDPNSCTDWNDLVTKTMQVLHGAADDADTRTQTEMHLYSLAQRQCFPDAFTALESGKLVPSSSRLLKLDPVYDSTYKVIRVGGRLHRSEDLPGDVKHPVVLDPKHAMTQLLIKEYDERLKHCGPERVLAEMRRIFWIIHGREAIRKYQRKCRTCQKWRGKPEAPKMADLPSARLRLFKPAFYSTGIDCFGPLMVKIARRLEKRWGILYKCMTTRAVYLDILDKMDTDSFLMSLRRFISRRGKPYEILCDRGTNFRGGQRELEEAWAAMTPSLNRQLAKQKISFRFNPPSAPHFGGAWEREIKCIKDGLKVIMGDQSVTEPVLQTVFAEIEGILNSKPLGYVSSDVRDIDPITPNVLLMGRLDQSLPQVVYPASEIIGRRRWRHSQVLADHFWKHYLRRYLPDLQLRSKWVSDKKDQRDIDCKDVVMIIDPQSVRATWLVGRVSKIHPSSDGRVRVATVTVGDRDIMRPVTRLIRLPECPDDN